MPPKKDASADAANLIDGFDTKECKLLAAACISMVGPDKYNYVLFAQLTGNTEGSLRKMWPPVKKKAIEAHPSFGAFLSGTAAASKAVAPKATPKKRKSDMPDADDAGDEAAEPAPADDNASPKKKKKAPAPKKLKAQAPDFEGAEDEAADGNASPKKKKAPGRPKKATAKEAMTNEAKAEEIRAARIKAEQDNSADADGDDLANQVEKEV